MPALHTLCLFRNRIVGLEAAITSLRLCPKLRSLDLDGNPLALEPGYRHHVVRALVRLETFDTEPVRALDRELSREFFFSQAQTCNASQPARLVSDDDDKHRFKWNSLPKGNVCLFDSDKLNNHPVALTYLANHVLSKPVALESVASAAASLADDHDRTDACRQSFVGRLRGSTQREQGETPQVDEDDDERGVTSQSDQRAAALHQSLAPVTSATDASDPYQTIRRLIQYIEILQRELAERRDSSASARDSSEIDQLRVENANMYHLREANATLRKDVETLRTRAARADELAKENRDLRGRLAASHPPAGTLDKESPKDGPTNEPSLKQTPSDAGLEDANQQLDSSPRPASGRSSTGSREARVLKVEASARDLGSPTISDILLLRSTSGDDDASWEAMSTPRRGAQGVPTSDKVVCTRHAWVLLNNRDADHRPDVAGSDDDAPSDG